MYIGLYYALFSISLNQRKKADIDWANQDRHGQIEIKTAPSQERAN